MQRVEGDGSQAALDLFNEQRDDLYAGRAPRINKDGLTVAALCNHFLTFKKARVSTGELTVRSFVDYKRSTDRLVRVFGGGTSVEGLNGPDFEQLRRDISAKRGPVATKCEIVKIKTIFNFAFRHDLVEKPVRFGAGFNVPSKRIIRKDQNSKETKIFTAEEIRAILKAADPTIRAMVLIGVNSGMGNFDLGMLPFTALDLETGWIDYPRRKTGVKRRFPLWPETIAAIKASIAGRAKPKPGNEKYVFLTLRGVTWATDTNAGALSARFRNLVKELGIYRKGVGFYALRHVFETIAGDSKDQVAVDAIMGHSRDDMASVYRERISDERLVAVVNHVRQWLFGKEADSTK